jgi:hypothetical protein
MSKSVGLNLLPTGAQTQLQLAAALLLLIVGVAVLLLVVPVVEVRALASARMLHGPVSSNVAASPATSLLEVEEAKARQYRLLPLPQQAWPPQTAVVNRDPPSVFGVFCITTIPLESSKSSRSSVGVS